jgi:alpha-glucosidase
MASDMGWPYMIVDWQWYGKFNDPSADITKWAPQISMPEILKYARAKKVKIILWLYSKDVNRNAAYKTAFRLYHQWGVAGVKIDFMDRDDQAMVNWYHDIIKCAAENHLLVDFHGAYKPDGIIRTWPNQITREGVMGNEYYKFSNKMSPEHNVKLAFTRMLAGPMDYTPGAFLNVTKENFKNQLPAVVWNTRAAELSKFIIYESPLTVVCDHPDHILNQPGADFLKIVPTTWDNIKYLGGYPGEYVALARQKGNQWFIGVLNNSIKKDLDIRLDFLPKGVYNIETWSDSENSDIIPTELIKTKKTIHSGEDFKIKLAKNGGFAARISVK